MHLTERTKSVLGVLLHLFGIITNQEVIVVVLVVVVK